MSEEEIKRTRENYILARRSNYDSARELHNKVFDTLEQLQTNWEELKNYLTKEQARIVIDNTDEDEFVYTDILIKMQEIESGKNE